MRAGVYVPDATSRHSPSLERRERSDVRKCVARSVPCRTARDGKPGRRQLSGVSVIPEQPGLPRFDWSNPDRPGQPGVSARWERPQPRDGTEYA